MDDVRILSLRARISDAAAMARLLQNVPDADAVRAELAQPCFTWRCQGATQHSYWLAGNGETALCLTVLGLNLDEVIAVWLAVDERRGQPGFTFSAQVLRDFIREELGVRAEVVDGGNA
ncbi:MAG: hypothetical protein M0038_08885 [Pseudomonadota bacterium]|jgi:hypothetical protein|nr:hypothetical protein [Pseudomonadota bacterium]